MNARKFYATSEVRDGFSGSEADRCERHWDDAQCMNSYGVVVIEIVKEEIKVPSGSEKMPSHLARPASGGPYPSVVVVMEAFGLNGHIKNVADRLAAEGFNTLAPDLYFRFPDNVAPYGDLPKALGMMNRLEDESALKDMGAAISCLKGLKNGKPAVGIVGFCMGGRIAFLTACRNREVTAAVPFYGGGMVKPRKKGQIPPITYVAQLTAPILAFFGGKDASIPLDDVERFRSELVKAGKHAEVVLYDEAEHGFMCDERASFHAGHAKEAWAKTVAFFKQHLK